MIDAAHIEQRLARLPAIEAELSDPATAAKQKKFRGLVQEHAALKRLAGKAERCRQLRKDAEEQRHLLASSDADAELVELARGELPEIERKLAAAESDLLLALLPPDAQDRRNAILEIRAGTGGDEAALFAADLHRMYTRFAAARGWKIGLIDASASAAGGYREVVFSVEGEEAYGTLRFESGVHRVQRVPVTEASGRIHTSTATVAVFPEAEAEDDIEIKPDEIRVDIFCASGPGGQSVNTTYSAVRITHLPTGLVAQSQDERSQHRNREKAIAVLKARLLDHRRLQEEQRLGDERRTQIGTGDRNERIRTYNYLQNRVTDHRINLTLYQLDRVIQGEIAEFAQALRAQHTQERLAALSGTNATP